MAEQIDKAGLVATVRHLVSTAQSGTLILRSTDGHVTMIVFEQGRLASISHGGHRGVDAIPLLLEFERGTYSFNDSTFGRAQVGLPSAEEFLALLDGASGPIVPAKPAVPTTPHRAPPPTSGSSFPVERVFDRIGAALLDYMGPIGPTLCRRVVNSRGAIGSHEVAWQVIQELADDIATEQDRQRFYALAEKIVQEETAH